MLIINNGTISKGAWTLGNNFKQQCDIGLTIAFLGTKLWLFEINKVYLASTTQTMNISLEITIYLTLLTQEKDSYILSKVQGLDEKVQIGSNIKEIILFIH